MLSTRESRNGYFDTMIDLVSGIEVEEVESALKTFEELEAYEYCAGIKLAIDDFIVRIGEDVKEMLK